MSIVYNITSDDLSAAGYRTLHAGDDYRHRFYLTSGEDEDPFDLSPIGTKIWFTIKESSIKSDINSKLQLSTSDNIEIISPPTLGEFVVKFNSEDTQDLEGTWLYDMQVRGFKDGSFKILTVARGLIEFLPNLTRAIT